MDQGAFKALSTLFPEPLLLVSVDGVVQMASDSAEKLGKAVETGLVGRRLHDLVEDEPEKVDECLKLFSRSLQTVPATFRWRYKEGASDMRCKAALVQRREGDTPALIAIRLQERSEALAQFNLLNERIGALTHEILQRKRAEELLRQSEEWLRFTQRCAHAGSWEWDIRTGRAVWSEEFYRLCGLEPGSLDPSFESWAKIVHRDDLERTQEQTKRAVECREDLSVEFRILHPVLGERWLASVGRTLYSEDGTPQRMAGLAIDITARKRAEIAARFLADAGSELSSSLDYETTLRNVARLAVPRFADWCALDLLDPEGKPRRLAVMHVDPAKIERAREVERRWPAPADAPHGVAAVLRTGMPEVVTEITPEMLRTFVHDQDHFRELEELGLKSYMCVPLVAHGRILGVLTFVSAESGRRYDEEDLRIVMELASRAATAIENATLFQAAQGEIQERRRAEAALHRYAEDLARSNAELRDFAYITSHDVKEPLRGISSVASLLLEDYSDEIDERGREKLQTLVRLSKRMYALLDALMEHARVGRVPLHVADCDMRQVVEETLESLRDEISCADVEVNLRPLPRLACDRTLVRELLAALLTNAIRYNTSIPKRVEIGEVGGAPGRTPVFYVRDNGIGIAPQHLQSIFRMFRRLHHRDQFGGGIGFGLTLARRIVDRHRGRIWVESSPGRGTTFYFTLQSDAELDRGEPPSISAPSREEIQVVAGAGVRTLAAR